MVDPNIDKIKEDAKAYGADVLKIITDTLNAYKGNLVLDLEKYAKPIVEDIIFFAPIAAAGFPKGARAVKHLKMQAIALFDIEGIEANDETAKTLVKIAEVTINTIFNVLVAVLKAAL